MDVPMALNGMMALWLVVMSAQQLKISRHSQPSGQPALQIPLEMQTFINNRLSCLNKKHMWLVEWQEMTKCVFCVLCVFVFFYLSKIFWTARVLCVFVFFFRFTTSKFTSQDQYFMCFLCFFYLLIFVIVACVLCVFCVFFLTFF